MCRLKALKMRPFGRNSVVVGCSLHGGMSIHAHKPPTIGDRRAQSTPSPQCNSWRHPFSRAGAWVSSARIHKQHDKAGSSTKHTTRMFPVNAAAAPLTATTQGCQNMLLQSLLCDCLPTCQSQQHVTISTLKNSQLLWCSVCVVLHEAPLIRDLSYRPLVAGDTNPLSPPLQQGATCNPSRFQ